MNTKNAAIPKIQYRNESYSGSEIRDAQKIISFEILELGNTDILETIAAPDSKLISDEFKEKLEKIEDMMKNGGVLGIEDTETVNSILVNINAHTGKNFRYALWLTDRDTVRDLYSDEYDDDSDEYDDIDGYETSDYVLADTGILGVLYLYEDMPEAY